MWGGCCQSTDRSIITSVRPDNTDRSFLLCDPIIPIDRSFRVLRVERACWLSMRERSKSVDKLSPSLSLSLPIYPSLSLSTPLSYLCYPGPSAVPSVIATVVLVDSCTIYVAVAVAHLPSPSLICHRRCRRCCRRRHVSSAASAISICQSILPPI